MLKSDPIFFRLGHKGITKVPPTHRNKMYGFILCSDLLNNLTFCQVVVQSECVPAAALLHCKLAQVLLHFLSCASARLISFGQSCIDAKLNTYPARPALAFRECVY